ncbi:MAG: hypothetical protein WD875_06250 [Pirellulales bacterium]
MQTALTILTAVSLLWHTLLGCCMHGHDGTSAGQRGAIGGGDEVGAHEDGAKEDGAKRDSHACCHGGHKHHDSDAPSVAGHNAECGAEHDDGDSPSHPCRCHGDGKRCQAIPSGQARSVDAPDVSFAAVPPLYLDCGVDALAAVRSRRAEGPPSKPALPLRAHLLYQSLLI